MKNKKGYLWSKIKIETQEQKAKNKYKLRCLTYEFLGSILIYASGVLPFSHVFIEDVLLKDEFFGYSSIHDFMLNMEIRLSIILLVIGFLILISIFQEDNLEAYKENLKLALLSPFISTIFFMTWVFIPGINFNILAYVFIGATVCAIVVFSTLKVKQYIQLFNLISLYEKKY